MSKKKNKFLARTMRRMKEMERQRQALEKRSSQNQGAANGSNLGELEITDVEQGSLEFSPDNKTFKYINEEGVSEIRDIEQIKVLHPSSDEWKSYVAAGGNPDIPKDEVPIQIIAKDTKIGLTSKDIEALKKAGTQFNGGNHVRQNDEMLSLIIESIHPNTRKVLPSDKALTLLESSTMGKFYPQNGLKANKELVDIVMDRVRIAASVDPNEEILLEHLPALPAWEKLDAANYTEESTIFYSSLLEADISPGIENKELNLVYDLLTDTTTRRIRFDQLNYPVWEGHTTHPTRNEGFITKPPFPKMYIEFNDFVELPLVRRPLPNLLDTYLSFEEEMSIALGSITFSNDIQHVLIQKNSRGTTRTILPQEGKTWKITPPQGTDSKYDGYSSEKNDSIMLGYLHWFGLVLNSNRETIGKINQGTYFDINTGTVWSPLNEITWDTLDAGQTGEALSRTHENMLELEKNRMITHLIPAGSGIESSALSTSWSSNRKLNIFEDTAIRVGDIFMFMMNYMTSPRMQTEEIQASRAERRRSQKSGAPLPPPWTTIAYKPPSNIKRNSVATGTGSKHSYMYDVRGHWKNQPHGSRREQRKLIWVHPHYSGLANETYIPRNRLVQEKEEYED